jgi:hypothetical protein
LLATAHGVGLLEANRMPFGWGYITLTPVTITVLLRFPNCIPLYYRCASHLFLLMLESLIISNITIYHMK